jgi:amidase
VHYGDALKGVRIAVVHKDVAPDLAARYDAALGVLRRAGAVLVDVEMPKLEGLGDSELVVLVTELKADLNSYLATTPPGVKTRTLADVIAFDNAHSATEMPFFGQETFVKAEATKGLDDPDYKAAREKSLRLAGKEGIEAMLAKADAALIVMPTYGAPWLSDTVNGDQYDGPSASELPAIAGTPHLTVPMGLVDGIPVGLSFIGPAYSEAKLLSAGYAYEQAAKARAVPKYLPHATSGPGLEAVRKP